jgi:two-component system response regulator
MQSGLQPKLILLADDDENDVFLIRRAFEKAEVPHTLAVADDGKAVVDYLQSTRLGENDHQSTLPALLLLDLHMPRMDGFDVLNWLSSRPDFSNLTVVVLSSSSLEADINKAKALGADDYHVKPSRFEGMVTLAAQIHARWLANAQPTQPVTLLAQV